MTLRSSLVAGLFLASAAVGTPARADPAFVPAACPMPGLDPSLAARLHCGTVAVARDRANRDAGSFHLAVAIVKAAPGPSQPDPVVLVAGVPLTAWAAAMASHAAVLAPERDLILVDERGVGRSEPLLCPALAEEQVGIFAAGQPEPALLAAWRQSYATCRLTMADDGIRPDWFGSQVSAEDIEDVRRALGIGRWTVYADRDGTPVATSLMALHPEGLRAVVLDGVLPPDPLPFKPAQTFSRALDGLFDECGRDAACAQAHPDLPAAYAEVEPSLDAEPLHIALTGAGPAAIDLRAQVFRLAVDRLLTSRAGRAMLPIFIDAVHHRDAATAQPILSEVLRRYAALPLGAMAAVGCRERASWRDAGAAGGAVDTVVPGLCADWSTLGPPPLLPPHTAVPSLVLAGADDPVTPPAFAALAAATLGPAATLVVLPHVAHGVAFTTPCVEAFVAGYVHDPLHPVDGTCLGRIAPVAFPSGSANAKLR